jgi:hypothetical protein
LGDARRTDRILSVSYFNEDKDRCLCILRAVESTKALSVTITVSIPITQLIVRDKSQDLYGQKRHFIEDELRSRSDEAAVLHSSRIARLRERMAGMGLAKVISAKQKSQTPWHRNGEVIAALQTHFHKSVKRKASE